MRIQNFVLCLILIIFVFVSCAARADQKAVINKYITAFNAHDEKLLRAVVADTAKYVGQSRKYPRPLIDQVIEAWSIAATKDNKLTWGKLNGKDIVVVWAQPWLAQGNNEWIKAAYLEFEVLGSKITREIGTLTFEDQDLQKKIIATPPK